MMQSRAELQLLKCNLSEGRWYTFFWTVKNKDILNNLKTIHIEQHFGI
jgi:hypothetical protein